MSHQSSKTLKVLVVISVYPPYYVGGYELGCKEVVEHLRKRGHNVLVVTSTYGVGERVMEGGVWRVMVGFISERFDNKISYFWHLLRREIINRYYFFKAVREFEPDVIYLWAILHLSSSVMFWANETRRRVVYFISDKWMAEWKNESWYRLWNSSKASGVRKGIGKLLNIFGLAKVSEPKFQAVGFCSNYIRQVTLESGVRVENHEVIHWGVQVEQYGPSNKDAKKILFAGQCLPHKGIETAIRGIYHLKSKLGITDVVLTVAGGSLDKQYYERIRALARELGLQNDVRFLGMVPREQVKELMKQNGVFLFPVMWDEPFSIALLEAMASGMVVVSTNTGGTPEILRHRVNALIFEKGNYEECAAHIKELVGDELLYERLRQNSLSDVRKFHIQNMVEKIERQLDGSYD